MVSMLNRNFKSALKELWLYVATASVHLITSVNRIALLHDTAETCLATLNAFDAIHHLLFMFRQKKTRAIEANATKHFSDKLDQACMEDRSS